MFHYKGVCIEYARLAMSPAILYLVTTTSSAIVGSSSEESARSAILMHTCTLGLAHAHASCRAVEPTYVRTYVRTCVRTRTREVHHGAEIWILLWMRDNQLFDYYSGNNCIGIVWSDRR